MDHAHAPGTAHDILIIDDERELRDALADALVEHGLRVATAENGREGLTYLRESPPPRLILLDLLMPVMNGWQFCEAKNADPRLKKIPVVALSAAARKDPSSPYYVPVDEVLAKPVMLEALLEAVNRFAPLRRKV